MSFIIGRVASTSALLGINITDKKRCVFIIWITYLIFIFTGLATLQMASGATLPRSESGMFIQIYRYIFDSLFCLYMSFKSYSTY